MQPAIALLEFDSVARGIEAGDAMAKRAPLDSIYAGTVQPGKYLVLIGGDTASVEESLESGRLVGRDRVIDEVYLPDIHPHVVAAIGGSRRTDPGDALGVIETETVAAIIQAADAGVKEAAVTLQDVRLADGLGGKGYCLFGGLVADVEAAVEAGIKRVPDQLVEHVVISRLDAAMDLNLTRHPRFGEMVAPLRARPLPEEG